MVRPKRMRRVVTCHRHELNKNLKPIELSVDEFEAIRFKDYHNIKQTESAEFMGISQSTFHRILNSARHKLSTSLIEGRPIVIVKGDTMIDPNKYLCEDCGFQWSNPEKEYGECPDCKSKNIHKLTFIALLSFLYFDRNKAPKYINKQLPQSRNNLPNVDINILELNSTYP